MSAAPPTSGAAPRPGQPRLSIWPRPWTRRRAWSPATITATPATAAQSRQAAASPPGAGPVPGRRCHHGPPRGNPAARKPSPVAIPHHQL